jgi:hypothetical protein
MTQLASTTQTPNAMVEKFARFWCDPHPEMLRGGVTDDVTVYYPGATKPEVGPDAYVAGVQRYLDAVPDLRLEVQEFAHNGDDTFVRWVARGTGAKGRFELYGIDRIRTRDGLVCENYVVYDAATFAKAVGL